MIPPVLSKPDQQPPPPRNVHLFSHPRTASNLLCHLLANQPRWTQSHYHFAKAYDVTREYLDQGRLADLKLDQHDALDALMRDGLAALNTAYSRANDEVNKSIFVKNHVAHVWKRPRLWQNIWGEKSASCSGHRQYLRDDPSSHGENPTVFPDDFSNRWLPVILIRHPALVFESWYRAETRVRPINLSDKSWGLYTTFRYSRELYDWLAYRATASGTRSASKYGSRRDYAFDPVVMDADDIVKDEVAVKKLCELCDMDPTLVRSEWDTLETGEVLSSRHASYMTGFWSSASVDRSKTATGISMDVKLDRWREEFGQEVAAQLRKLVGAALPDYHYLHDKRLR